jgi:hypothetical protein
MKNKWIMNPQVRTSAAKCADTMLQMLLEGDAPLYALGPIEFDVAEYIAGKPPEDRARYAAKTVRVAAQFVDYLESDDAPARVFYDRDLGMGWLIGSGGAQWLVLPNPPEPYGAGD